MSTDENKLQRGEWFEGQFYPDEGDDQDELPAPPRKTMPEADRQLLELAARAIGAVRVEDVEGEQWVNLHFEDGSTTFGWNPLRHSDDTFDLHVRLHMSVEVSLRAAIAWFRPTDGARMIDCTEETGNDPKAATRRAITRAAAEVFKQRSA